MEDWQMKCTECRHAEMAVSRENIRYEECGLPNVVLKDIEVKRCSECGITLVSIPALAGLHKSIATHLVQQSERLSPSEICFLRKYMGWSKTDFARKLHVRTEQVSRWESEHKPVPMNKQSELLLRSLVALGNKIDDYGEKMEKLTLEYQKQPSILSLFFDRYWQDGLATAC
jgi:putative zinc finger/helix-turn-helix YgiT family protein